MKRYRFNRKNTLLFIEFAVVCAFLLLPPLFSVRPFTLPPKPFGLYAQCRFWFYTMCAALYEEALYRLYTPARLHLIYTDYIKPHLQERLETSGSDEPLLLLSLQYRLCRNTNTEGLYALFFTEFPAILFFALAHRYLGLYSMLFAAGAGVVFRIAYLKLKHALHPAFSIALVAMVHGGWNIGVYYYLWGNPVTV